MRVRVAHQGQASSSELAGFPRGIRAQSGLDGEYARGEIAVAARERIEAGFDAEHGNHRGHACAGAR